MCILYTFSPQLETLFISRRIDNEPLYPRTPKTIVPVGLSPLWGHWFQCDQGYCSISIRFRDINANLYSFKCAFRPYIPILEVTYLCISYPPVSRWGLIPSHVYPAACEPLLNWTCVSVCAPSSLRFLGTQKGGFAALPSTIQLWYN